MTLIGNRRQHRVSARGRVPSVAPHHSAAPDASALTPHASRLTLAAPRFTLRLSCLTLPALLLLSATPAFTYGADTPYQGIVERNVFGLKPPTPPPSPDSLKPPPPKLTLTGILTIFGKKQALLKAPPTPAGPPKPGQPPEPPREHSYYLAEGQREDGITVLKIDEVAKTVKVDADGTIVDLTFSTNETRTASSPGPGLPGIPSPTGNGPVPGFAPARTIPRPLRIPSMGSSSATTVGDSSSSLAGGSTMGAPGYGAVPGGVNMDGTTLGFNNAAQPQSTPPVSTAVSAEADALMVEATRLKYQNEGNPRANLFPPTMLSPRTPAGGNQQQTGGPRVQPYQPGMPAPLPQ